MGSFDKPLLHSYSKNKHKAKHQNRADPIETQS